MPHRPTRLLTCVALGMVLSLVERVSGQQPAPLSRSGVSGVWRMCYEPGLPDISEVDSGYLFLNPNGSYVQIMAGLDEPDITENGRYRVEKTSLVLNPTERLQPGGRSGGGRVFKPYVLRFLGEREVVFWPEKSNKVRALVLSRKDISANYGWAKVF